GERPRRRVDEIADAADVEHEPLWGTRDGLPAEGRDHGFEATVAIGRSEDGVEDAAEDEEQDGRDGKGASRIQSAAVVADADGHPAQPSSPGAPSAASREER